MRENLTEIVFILDRSGSMARIADDTIGGFNSFIESQKKEPGDALLTTVLFDDRYEILHNGVNLKDVTPMTDRDYWARGLTSLYDAVGRTIDNVGVRLSGTPEEERPSKVIVVITTDGYENSSRAYTKDRVKEMIKHQTEKYNWQFLFLGANIDSAEQAESIGISSLNSANYVATSKGVESLYSAVDCTIATYRTKGSIDNDWSRALNLDEN